MKEKNKFGKIFIIGEINGDTYLQVAQGLRNAVSNNLNRVDVYINSSGGEVESALAIIDDFGVFKSLNKDIYTIAIGEACSSGALILAYGTKRFATENSTMMLHPFSYDLGEKEHQATKSYVSFADDMYKKVMASLAMRCGRNNPSELKKFISDIRDGKWLDVDTAIDFGLIDGKWDYSLENLK
jgi:ATP-dependent Clp protease protease subunit